MNYFVIISDGLKEREKLVGKRKKKRKKDEDNNENEKCTIEGEDAEEFFDDAPPHDENSSFQQMNLSRPLMKVRINNLHNILFYTNNFY